MTNPDNIIRVRARNGGRASVYEANAWCQNWTTGFVDGLVQQNTSVDMNVLVGGSQAVPDVAIAATPGLYNIALDIVGKKPIALTAPATNSRYSAIVAYTDDLSLATTEDTVTGSPSSCGLIVVNGTASANPVYPTAATIRSAITADGATGSQAAYVVLAYVLVSSTTTTITDSLITNNVSELKANKVSTSSIKDNAITASKIDFTTFTDNNNNIRKIYKYSFTDTTDSNGFVGVSNTVVKPSTGDIIGTGCTNLNCFTSIFSDQNNDRYSIRCDQYNWSPIAQGSTATIDIYYILY